MKELLFYASTLLALSALAACGAGDAPAEQLELTIVAASSETDSLRYELQAAGFGVEGASATYVFECERSGDGTSVVSLSTGGNLLATATRTANDEVTLSTASGLLASSDSGTLQVSEAQRSYLTAAQWIVLDATVFSQYPMPTQAADDLEAWRNGLDLVNTADPAEEAALSPQRTSDDELCFPIIYGNSVIWVCVDKP